MKKKNLKSLNLNKKSISIIENSVEVKGGSLGCPSGSIRFCSFGCTLACGNTTDPAPSTVPACYDK